MCEIALIFFLAGTLLCLVVVVFELAGTRKRLTAVEELAMQIAKYIEGRTP